MENSVNQTAVPVSTSQSSNPQSLFRKPDIFCRFSACLHTLGAISILIGCLLIKAYTIVGVVFLIVGFLMTVVGIVMVLMAVSLVLRKGRKRKHRNNNRKYCDKYRSDQKPGELKLELVSSYFTPIVKPRSQSLTVKTPSASPVSLDTQSVEPNVKHIKKSKINLVQLKRKVLKPELTVEPPPEDLSRTPTPIKRRLAFSPSLCSTNTSNDEICIPFYPPRSPAESVHKECPPKRCSPQSMSRSVSRCSLNSQMDGFRSRSVSPQRHKTFIN